MLLAVSTIKRFALITLILLLVVGINMPGNMVARLHINQIALWTTISVLVIAGMIVHMRIAFIVAIVVLVAMANAPHIFPESLRLDQDVAIAALIAVVLGPYLVKKLGWE